MAGWFTNHEEVWLSVPGPYTVSVSRSGRSAALVRDGKTLVARLTGDDAKERAVAEALKLNREQNN